MIKKDLRLVASIPMIWATTRAIFGYIFLNFGIIESGSGILNFGLMNLIAGCISLFIFQKEVFKPFHLPDFKMALVGALGVVEIVFGLQQTHMSWHDPGSTMDFIYDVLVFGGLPIWIAVDIMFKLEKKTPIYWWDLTLHVFMLALVLYRLWIHWGTGWEVSGFGWAAMAIFGYWIFNISVERASGKLNSRATNITMNLSAGFILLGISIFRGGDAVSVNHGTILGAFGVVMIVTGLGTLYKRLSPKGLKPMVLPLVYDGLLIVAPLVMSIVYKKTFDSRDWFISLGFLIILLVRATMYVRETKKHQMMLQPI